MNSSQNRNGGRFSGRWRAFRQPNGWRAPLLALLSSALFLLTYSHASALMGGLGLTWSILLSEPVKLVVCWENPTAADPLLGENDQSTGAQRREWVRLALKQTWEREARVVFVGWQQCQNESTPTDPPHTLGPRRPGTLDENIKIYIQATDGGMNPGHGSWGDYQQSGVLLNLHFHDQAWYEALAIHEFGHVLGLYHEEERSEWPTDIPGCPPQTYPPSDPWWPIPTEMRWGAPDRYSVMAYCSGGPNQLSAGDVAGIQHLYLRHLPGTLLSLPGSLCLSDSANAANGANAFGWACDEANDDQEWHYDTATSALYIQWPADPTHKRRCLDVDTLNYSDVQIWDCNGWPNQQWQFRRTYLRGYGGLCLTRPDSGAGPLSMQPCAGADSQLWRVDPGDFPGFVRFRSESGNLCLTRDGASGSDALATSCLDKFLYLPLVTQSAAPRAAAQGGTAPAGGPASGPAALAQSGIRDFQMGAGAKLVSPGLFSDDLCLDVQDVWDSDYVAGLGGPAAGQRAQFFTCAPAQLNQRWGLTGDVVSGDKCLALAGSGIANGDTALVAACNGSTRQDWDYHW